MKRPNQLEEPLLWLLARDFMRFAEQVPGCGREAWIAVGTVALWGRVIEGDRGYRAELAYPQSLWVLPPALFGRADPARAADLAPDLLSAMRSRYGVEVGYVGHSAEWNSLTLLPSVGPFFRWRFDNAGADAFARAIGTVGEPSDRLPAVRDALRLHVAGFGYGEGRQARLIVDTYLAPAFGDVPLRRIGRRHLAAYRAAPPRNPRTGRPYSPRTVRRHLAVLRASLRDAAARGWFTAAPS